MAFDAVCSFNGVFAGPAIAVARIAGIRDRVVWHRRSTPAYGATHARRAYAWFVTGLIERYATRILSNSVAALNEFHGSSWPTDGRFSVIPNGVDAGRFRPDAITRADARRRLSLPPDDLIFGHVGRFDPAKNHGTMFEVIRELARRHCRFRFVFCGTGTDSPAFFRRLRDHGIEEACISLGRQSRMPCVYRSLDAFYFPSWTEGQPNALIEAMLSEVPFVAADIPGIRAAVPPWALDRLIAPSAVNEAAELLLVERGRSERELRAVRDWAKQTFDLERNLSEALSAMLPAAGTAGRHA
jgi:glycosyltransferase involved in cell wall biosynthesis